MKKSQTARFLGAAMVALLSVTGCSEFFTSKTYAGLDASTLTFDADTYPAVVLGGGVGGMTAGVYLAMANIKTLLVQGPTPGGLLTQSLSVRNWPGELETPGLAVTDKLLAQTRKQGVEVAAQQLVSIDTKKWPYSLVLADVSDASKTRTVKALSVVIATGALSNYLGIEGEKEYWSKGVTNCAVCEGALYKNKDVCVVGGGNSAITEAEYLAGLARSVTVFVRGSKLRATDRRKDDLMRMKNVTFVYNTTLKKIEGNGDTVTQVTTVNSESGTQHVIQMDAVFLAIGFTPNTAPFKSILMLDKAGYIVRKRDQETSMPGIFAVGDVTDPVYKQAVTAAGDGCRAALQAQTFLSACKYVPHAQWAETERHSVKEQHVATAPKEEISALKKGDVVPVSVQEISSEEEIESLLKQGGKPIVIDFYAPWCRPCRDMMPLIKSLANRYADKALFVKVNIDNLDAFATRHRIRGVPTFVFTKGGQERDRIVGGGVSEAQFAAKIDALL